MNFSRLQLNSLSLILLFQSTTETNQQQINMDCKSLLSQKLLNKYLKEKNPFKTCFKRKFQAQFWGMKTDKHFSKKCCSLT